MLKVYGMVILEYGDSQVAVMAVVLNNKKHRGDLRGLCTRLLTGRPNIFPENLRFLDIIFQVSK